MDTYSKQKIKLGIFVILGIALFTAGIYLIGKKQTMFGNSLIIYATFDHINGVKEGNNVRFSGINVGTVTDIEMKSDTLIILKLTIQKKFSNFIQKNAKCSVASDGLVGSMIINIISSQTQSLPVTSGDTLKSASLIRTEEMLTTLSVTNENAALLTVDLLRITKQILDGKGVLATMLRDSTITESLKDLIVNLQKTSKDASLSMQKIHGIIDELDHDKSLLGTLRDTSYAAKVKDVMNKLQGSSQKLNSSLSQLETLVNHADEAVLNLKDGDGVVNYLSNDKGLVMKMDSTVEKVQQTLNEFQKAGALLNRDLKALEHHWFLRSAFKKMDKTSQ